MAAPASVSRAKSRSETASSELAVGPVEAQRLGGHLAVDRERSAGECRGAERTLIEPRACIGEAAAVAGQHLDIGQEMMTERHRLGRLQVREPRHDEVEMRLRLPRERELQRGKCPVGAVEPVAHVEPEVGRHLVVARARRMQPAGRRTDQLGQPRLDVHVHVLERARERECAGFDLGQNAVEAGVDLTGVVLGDDALGGQHGCMRLRGAHVVRGQSLVEADGGVYLLHDLGRRHGEAATPHLVGVLSVTRWPYRACAKPRTRERRC